MTLTTRDGYTLRHVLGADRTRAQAFIRSHHYTASDGGSGFMYAVFAPNGDIAGACLVGPTLSTAADRALVAAPWRVEACKRLVAADDCPVPESQILRYALRSTANRRGETTLFVSYADPCARDTRTDLPLSGAVYLAAGHFFVGETSQPRYAVFDEQGRVRSTRQGKTTLSKGSMPDGWRIQRVPAARIWVAIVTPETIPGPDEPRQTTQRWRKHQWLSCFHDLNPARRVRAIQWIEERAWERAEADGATALGDPRKTTGNARFQPARWQPGAINRSASPVWEPMIWQTEIIGFNEHETTAGRSYVGRVAA